MSLAVRSFAKINLGLRIGPRRSDGFHELLTIYQTIALHDVLRVELVGREGIQIHCVDPRVPTNEQNTCWRIAERVLQVLELSSGVRIEIEKRLPVQGGLGAASSNAVATLLAIERLSGHSLREDQRKEIAAAVGSDLPLFLVGGTVAGSGRGEQVDALPDLPTYAVVVVTPSVGVSTAKAFADWDRVAKSSGKLTLPGYSDRINEFSAALAEWLGSTTSGVPVQSGKNRVESRMEGPMQPLLDLVRTGIKNDFERVVFPEHAELSEAKERLYSLGAQFASLSGSGSSLYGLFASVEEAERSAAAMNVSGFRSEATRTLGREKYWKSLVIEELEN